MARTLLNPQAVGAAGAALGFVVRPADEGDAVPPGCYLLVRNTTAAAIDVTIVTGGTRAGLAVADIGPQPVAAGAVHAFGPFTPREVFVQPTGTEAGRVHVNYSASAGVERTAVAAS